MTSDQIQLVIFIRKYISEHFCFVLVSIIKNSELIQFIAFF